MTKGQFKNSTPLDLYLDGRDLYEITSGYAREGKRVRGLRQAQKGEGGLLSNLRRSSDLRGSKGRKTRKKGSGGNRWGVRKGVLLSSIGENSIETPPGPLYSVRKGRT